MVLQVRPLRARWFPKLSLSKMACNLFSLSKKIAKAKTISSARKWAGHADYYSVLGPNEFGPTF